MTKPLFSNGFQNNGISSQLHSWEDIGFDAVY